MLKKSLLLVPMLAAFSPSSINPKDYGVTFDGSTDDTAAWQYAINAAQSYGLPIHAPCGTSVVSGQLTIPSPMMVMGGGMGCTTINEVGTGQYVIKITAAGPVTLRDFTIECTGRGNYAIDVYPTPPLTNYGSRFNNIELFHCAGGIDLPNAYLWVADGVNFNSPGATFAFLVANVVNSDIGDSVISNSQLLGGANGNESGGSGVLQLSSGGLKILGTKFTGWQYGYHLNANGGTSELSITGSNFDGNAVCIDLTTNGLFSNFNITGNIFSDCGSTIVGP